MGRWPLNEHASLAGLEFPPGWPVKEPLFNPMSVRAGLVEPPVFR